MPTIFGKTYSLSTLRSGEHTEVTFDFNNDGYQDIAILANSIDSTLRTDTDRFPVLSIFFGTRTGEPTCWRQFTDIFLPNDEESYVSYDYSLATNTKGALLISISEWMSAGSWSATSAKFTFRYQGDGFLLIGYDESTLARNTGTVEDKSVNLLTNRMCTVRYNEFDPEVPRKEQWTKLSGPIPTRYLGQFIISSNYDCVSGQ